MNERPQISFPVERSLKDLEEGIVNYVRPAHLICGYLVVDSGESLHGSVVESPVQDNLSRQLLPALGVLLDLGCAWISSGTAAMLTRQELMSWSRYVLPITSSFALNPQKGYKDTCPTSAWSATWLGEGVETFERSPASE